MRRPTSGPALCSHSAKLVQQDREDGDVADEVRTNSGSRSSQLTEQPHSRLSWLRRALVIVGEAGSEWMRRMDGIERRMLRRDRGEEVLRGVFRFNEDPHRWRSELPRRTTDRPILRSGQTVLAID